LGLAVGAFFVDAFFVEALRVNAFLKTPGADAAFALAGARVREEALFFLVKLNLAIAATALALTAGAAFFLGAFLTVNFLAFVFPGAFLPAK
jgi:hypothetical protein